MTRMPESGGDDVRKVLFLTGTRADFGKLKALMLQVDNAPEFECRVFATGMHTMRHYGNTLIEIERCGFEHIFQFMNQTEHTGSDMDIVLAATMEGLGRYVREYPPDLIVVHGDRIEALAGAIVGALNNILVAHIEGGEVSGTVDDLIRHAVSKLAHLHFVANTEAKSRLLQMGEERSTVFVIGSPDIDIMFSESLPSIEEAKQRYDIEFDEYAVFTYHPVTTEVRDLRQRIQAVVAALRASGWNYVVIYPNNDMGAEIILEHIEPLSDDPHFRVFPSIRFEHFLTLLRNAKAIVGNSSAGIREAPAYCVPAVNIGTRQMNRFQHSSIVTVGDDTQEILNALNDLPQIQVPSHHFGTGNSSELFLQCFRDPAFWQTPCQKQFQDVLLA